MSYFRVALLHVTCGQCDDFPRTRNSCVHCPPSLHDGAREETEKQDDGYRVRIPSAAVRDFFKGCSEYLRMRSDDTSRVNQALRHTFDQGRV